MKGARKYFERLLHVDEEINAKQRAADKFKAQLLTISASQIKTVNVRHNTLPDERIETYVDMCAELNQMIDRLCDLRMEAVRRIDFLPNRMERAVLIERYINALSWEELAQELNYSRQQLVRIHDDALRHFSKLNKDVTKCYKM